MSGKCLDIVFGRKVLSISLLEDHDTANTVHVIPLVVHQKSSGCFIFENNDDELYIKQ